jgi:hypothetical protein
MNPYINVYKDNPTANGTDGTPISYGGDFTSPISVELDATINESKIYKLGVRCTDGFKTTDKVILQANSNADKVIKLSLNQDGPFTETLEINDTIKNKNAIFYAKFSTTGNEDPGTNNNFFIKINTMVDLDEENGSGVGE